MQSKLWKNKKERILLCLDYHFQASRILKLDPQSVIGPVIWKCVSFSPTTEGIGTWTKLLWIFFHNEADHIRSIPLRCTYSHDRIAWHYSEDGLYSVKCGYKVARSIAACRLSTPSSSGSNPQLWNRVWNLNVAPKVKLFLWKCLHGILPTNTDGICALNPDAGKEWNHWNMLYGIALRAFVFWKASPIRLDPSPESAIPLSQ